MKRRVAKKQVRAVDAGLLPDSVRLWLSTDDDGFRDIAVGLLEIALGLVLSFGQMVANQRNSLGGLVHLDTLERRGLSELVGIGTVTWSRAFGDEMETVEGLEVEFDLSTLRKHRISYVLKTGNAEAA